MRLICILGVALTAAFSMGQVRVRGVIHDGTGSGKGSADSVRLIYLGGGMEPVHVLEGVDGSFELIHDGEFEAGKYLVQAVKGRAIYSKTVENPSKPVVLMVYDNNEDAALEARVGSMAFLAYGSVMEIGVFYNLDNKTDPPVTLDRDGATFSFSLIPGFREVEANTMRGSMPLRQNLAIEGDRASLSYPITPGRTLLRVHGMYDYDAASANRYVVPFLEGQKFMHVLVMPSQLKVEAPGLEFVETDEQTKYDLYQWTLPTDSRSAAVTVSGQPAASREAVSQQTGGESRQTQAQPASRFERTPNPVEAFRWWIIGAIVFLFSIASLLTFVFQKS